MRTSLALAIAVALTAPVPAFAATYYIGSFSGSTSLDDADCGTGMGTHPSPHPCRTLAHWRGSRNLGANGDTVRLAPGTYTSSAASHCFDMAKTGVTYRGSNANGSDTTDRSLVVVSGSSGGGDPCRGAVVKFVSGTSTNMTLRDMTVSECASSDNGHCLQFSPQPGQGTLTGLTVRNVRVTKAPVTGLWVGAYDSFTGGSELREPFNLSNVTIVDSEFDGNCFGTGSEGQGVNIAAVNGGEIARNKIHDNNPCSGSPSGSAPNSTCNRKAFPPSCASGGCNCDGLHMGGRNFLVHDNEIYSNEEDGIDLSPNGADNDCPVTSSRFHTLYENLMHDNGVHNLSLNGCSHDLMVYNNIIWGGGVGINQYECGGYNSSFYNNTVVSQNTYALFVYATMWPVTFENNIFVSNSSDASVWIDAGSTNTSSTWSNNVVYNSGSGSAAKADFVTEGSHFPNCTTGSTTNCCTAAGGPRSAGSIPAVGRTTSQFYSNGQLGNWTADGNAGQLFGNETGAQDRWAMPAFVNGGSPSAANLHLAPSDSIAQNRGASIGNFNTDIDGSTRPQGVAWDIGAHEVGGTASAPAAPTLVSVDPIP